MDAILKYASKNLSRIKVMIRDPYVQVKLFKIEKASFLNSQVFENYKASTIGIFSFFLKFSTCESVIHYKISLGKNETSYLPLAR